MGERGAFLPLVREPQPGFSGGRGQPLEVAGRAAAGPPGAVYNLTRESGICPIREELHNQCFDEIIRQVTIDGPERGLLLMRVRDELKMTIAAY